MQHYLFNAPPPPIDRFGTPAPISWRILVSFFPIFSLCFASTPSFWDLRSALVSTGRQPVGDRCWGRGRRTRKKAIPVKFRDWKKGTFAKGFFSKMSISLGILDNFLVVSLAGMVIMLLILIKSIGTEKGSLRKGVFSVEASLESLKNSLDSLENGRTLLCFPESGGSLESLNSLEPLETDFLKRPLFQTTPSSEPEKNK